MTTDIAPDAPTLHEDLLNRAVSVLMQATMTEDGIDPDDALELADAIQKRLQLSGKTTDWHRCVNFYDQLCLVLGVDNGDEIDVLPLVREAVSERNHLRALIDGAGEELPAHALVFHVEVGCVMNYDYDALRESAALAIAKLTQRAEAMEKALENLSECEICDRDLIAANPDGSGHNCVCLACWNKIITRAKSAESQLAAANEKVRELSGELSRKESTIVSLNSECDQLNDKVVAQTEVINNVAMIGRRMSYALKRAGENDSLVQQCVTLFKKYNLGGSVIRESNAAIDAARKESP